MRICEIDGCTNQRDRWRLCQKHADRLAKHGNPHHAAGSHDLVERFNWLAKPATNGCLIWTGEITNREYGRIKTPNGKTLVHRWAYEKFVGPIPDGMVIDHLCGTPACVNIEHLQPVTQHENVHRSPITPAFINKAKTQCKWGHPFDEANTYVSPANGSRKCRDCQRWSTSRYRQRGN